jgi:predicted unusual protein kinase regulating ubiquinone biosynthesis (AarF/ABC1/UbiB family)
MLNRLSRFVDVGTKLGSFALNFKNESYAPVFREILGNLKGPFVKVAQFLSTIPDAIPAHYAKELQALQSKAPPMPQNKVERCLEACLGREWGAHFQEFNLNPFAAASLGQVHKATLISGERVACKLQYPNMQSYCRSDLHYLSLFFSVYKKIYGAIDPDLILKEMRERLFEELDYIKETKMMKRFSPYAKVPNVFSNLTTGQLITMDYMDGYDFLGYGKMQSQEWKNEVAAKLFSMWYTPFYKQGLLHADPHPGNYLVTPDQEIQWLDFGCVRQFDMPFVEGVKDLRQALVLNDRDLKMHAYALWGFQNLNKETEEAVTLWAKLIFDPVLDNKTRPIQPSFSAKEGWRVAQDVHNLLTRSGGIRPPQTFVFMDRVAVGLGGVFMQLQANVNWYRLYEEMM